MSPGRPQGGRWSAPAAIWLALTPALLADPDFRLLPRKVEIPERGQVAAYTLRQGTNQIQFVPPSGWITRPDPATRQVILEKPDLSAAMTLKLLETADPEPEAWEPSQLRQTIRQRFPNRKIVREFAVTFGEARGYAFELSSTQSRGLKLSQRLAFLRLAARRLECQLNVAATNVESCHGDFTTFINSLRLAPAETVITP